MTLTVSGVVSKQIGVLPGVAIIFGYWIVIAIVIRPAGWRASWHRGDES